MTAHVINRGADRTAALPQNTLKPEGKKRLSLQEMLTRTLDDDMIPVNTDAPDNRERFDEDEGAFGG